MKILFSNLGYATGINGTLRQHAGKALRHAFQTKPMQNKILAQFRAMIAQHKPDLCCVVEIDQGSLHSGYFNQMEALKSADYPFFDIADKYGPGSRFSKLPFHEGKSNGFLARQAQTFSHHYFQHGTKRLIYKIALQSDLTLFFAHFSLNAKTRANQFVEMKRMAEQEPGGVIIFGDFNIFTGPHELKHLLEGDFLCLLNTPDIPTFRFYRWQHTLDLCLCSPSLMDGFRLQVIDQPFSDHDALLLEAR